jgi:hypothetical protein
VQGAGQSGLEQGKTVVGHGPEPPKGLLGLVAGHRLRIRLEPRWARLIGTLTGNVKLRASTGVTTPHVPAMVLATIPPKRAVHATTRKM